MYGWRALQMVKYELQIVKLIAEFRG